MSMLSNLELIRRVPLFALLEVLCELAMPLLMSRIIDVGIANQDIGYIGRTGLYRILLAAVAVGVHPVAK